MFLYYVLTIATVAIPSYSCYKQLPGGRLADFPQPDYQHTFPLSSQYGHNSFAEIDHGLDKLPYHLNVKVSSKEGDSAGFYFDGTGACQNAGNNGNYGGVLFAYSDKKIRIWAPTEYAGNTNGRIIFVGDGWGGDKYTQSSHSADITIQAWKDGPEPNFQMSYQVDSAASNRPYIHRHGLHQLPDRISVRVTALFPIENEQYYFHAAGSSQNPPNTRQFGGVTFGYNEDYVKIWLPNSNKNSQKLQNGCITIGKGWGAGLQSSTMFATKCRIEVRLWVQSMPPPSFQTDWFYLAANSHEQSFREIHHQLGRAPLHIIVQVKRNNTQGAVVFEGSGSVMATEFSHVLYGGIVYAYNNHSIRLWVPSSSRNDTGRIALISEGWSREVDRVNITSGLVRVLVFSDECKHEGFTGDGQMICRKYTSSALTWETNSWQKCSKPCGSGMQNRRIDGCRMSQMQKSFQCDFENGFCGFQSSQEGTHRFDWQRTRGEEYGSRDDQYTRNNNFFLHAFGYPKGSWFAFTNMLNSTSKSTGSLSSPLFKDSTNCHLHFMYRTGVYFGNFWVEATTDNRVWLPVWRMGDDQLRKELWVNGYVNIGDSMPSNVIKRFRFHHELDEECASYCSPVAIDDVSLYCDKINEAVIPMETCVALEKSSPGCEIDVFNPIDKGKAFHIINTDKGKFVAALGNQSDPVASYSFKITRVGEYLVWIETFTHTFDENSVSLQINNGSWEQWNAILKNGSSMWNVFTNKIFTLGIGDHLLNLKQLDKRYSYRNIRISPQSLQSWTDLGMQNHRIDDSRIESSLFVLTEKEQGQFARLHGVGAWWPQDINAGSLFLEINLTNIAFINKISTQGGSRNDPTQLYCRTDSYKIKVSIDGVHFAFYRNSSGLVHLFTGNKDHNTVVTHTLPYVAVVKSIRFYPWKFENFPCMRIELYGSYLEAGMCPKIEIKPQLSQECIGDRNCGENAHCANQDIITTGGTFNNPEKCMCNAGFHGNQCQFLGCNPNPCKNGGSCQTKKGKFQCDCPAGYRGNICQYICPEGFFGRNCMQKCSCVGESTCDPLTGNCTCNRGYDGLHCNKTCPIGSYGMQCKQQCSCSIYTTCDTVNGSCYCKAGSTGQRCEMPCSQNRFGRNCSFQCNCLNGGKCNSTDGSCSCKAGWYGKYCSIPCKDSFYGPNCRFSCSCSENAICSPLDGSCTCDSGWIGTNCTKRCSPRRFGFQCMNRCYCRWKNTLSCDPSTGMCLCQDGFSGDTCRKICPVGTFGAKCGSMCACQNDGRCDNIDGSCTCAAGFIGNHCEKRCPPERYGLDCMGTCNCYFNQTLKCDFKDGSCMCKPGYHGAKCSKSCPEGRWGRNCISECSCNNGACDPVDGFCTCQPGWRGWDCIEQCNSTTFGVQCKNDCKCGNGATCSRFDGSCTCLSGFTGQYCESICPLNTFGLKCQQNCLCKGEGTDICDHISGKCICKLGFYGATCDKSCPDGSYGFECQMRCFPCPHSQGTCDKTLGNCSCSPGFYGYSCLNDCDWNHYGYQCVGHCLCQDGYLCNNVNAQCYNADYFTFKIPLIDKKLNDIYPLWNDTKLFRRNFERFFIHWHDVIQNSIQSYETLPEKSRRSDIANRDRYIVRVVSATKWRGDENEDVLNFVFSAMDNSQPIYGRAINEAVHVIGSGNLTQFIGYSVYNGILHSLDNDGGADYFRWIIIGASCGLALFAMVCSVILYRYYHRPISSIYKVKRSSIDMELQPCLGGNGHVLAFDNPYYDVIAAMGLDDDIEEEYYNPLYDDSSLFGDDRASDVDGYYHNEEDRLYQYDRDSGISSGTF